MDFTTLQQSILQFVHQPGYRPMKPRIIARNLGVPKEQAADVKKAVKRMVRQGQLQYGSNHLVLPILAAADAQTQAAAADAALDKRILEKLALRLPASRKAAADKSPSKIASGRVVGRFSRTAKGFGFVRLAGTGKMPVAPGAGKMPVAPDEKELADVYIPAKYAGNASTGDTVLVQISKRRRGEPGVRGEIVEILERQTNQFVGTYFESRGSGYVQVDGTLFARPISVGDPGAKNARPDDKVVFEMVRFPSPLHDGEGVITEVLGPRGKPGVDTLSILREYNLVEPFPEDVLEDARVRAEKFAETVPAGRTDYSKATIVTIDPEDARDFDDAISLERLDGGNWLLGVHIADVSHFVQPKSPLDREARNRATSVYLPDRVIPMLPEIISNGLASLQPGKVRLTKTALIEFTPEGLQVGVELQNSAIKSAKRLTYEQVDAFLADPEAWRKKLGAKVHALLEKMRALAAVLRARRMKKGALELTMPEVKIELDKNGRVSGARVVENTESHQIIEEFMLAANEAVAETIERKGWPFIRRVHQPPTPRKLKALTAFVKELGFKVESLESRFELQKLLKAASGRPDQHAVNFATLRSLQRAVYNPVEEGHYALASDCYCHFTSPIRRYPDLTVHRLVDALLAGQSGTGPFFGGKTRSAKKRKTENMDLSPSESPASNKPRFDLDKLHLLAQHCSDREQRAEAAERELTKMKLLAYMSTRIGEEMEAVVTGVESYGLFVQGVQLPAEGLIHVDSLADDYYDFDRASHTLAGRRAGNAFRLGDLLRVVVARVDLERRELDFRLAARKKHSAAKAGKKPVEKSFTRRRRNARRK
ncbi:MAG: ribonuclease R [Pirellulales bacterium]|nr:ribonuclease R [Pirellulales bacterium]